MTPEHEFAVEWWKKKHGASGQSYFPGMDQHKDWHIYTEQDLWIHKEATLSQNDTALEIGCGYGQWMIPLSRHCFSVYGFDIHSYLCQKAEEKFKEHGVTNCHVKLGDGFSIPFTNRVFGFIYSISVFQHIPRSAVAVYLHQAKDLLLPSGTGVFHFRHATPNKADGPYAQDITVDHAGDWSVGWTEQEVIQAALIAGWRQPSCRVTGHSIILTAY